MATPNVNTNCYRLVLTYGAGGIFRGTYYNCGDLTPIVLSATGGVSGALYTVVNGLSGGLSITTGAAAVTGTIGGYSQTWQAWTEYVTTKNP